MRWTPEGLDDLECIYAFDQDRSEALAKKTERRLIARACSLPAVPHQGRPAMLPGLRLLSLPDIRYVITYRIAEDAIWLVRVHHTRENRERP